MATKPKKNTLRDGSIGAAIVAALVVLLQLLGYMPGNAEPQTIPPCEPTPAEAAPTPTPSPNPDTPDTTEQ